MFTPVVFPDCPVFFKRNHLSVQDKIIMYNYNFCNLWQRNISTRRTVETYDMRLYTCTKYSWLLLKESLPGNGFLYCSANDDYQEQDMNYRYTSGFIFFNVDNIKIRYDNTSNFFFFHNTLLTYLKCLIIFCPWRSPYS